MLFIAVLTYLAIDSAVSHDWELVWIPLVWLYLGACYRAVIHARVARVGAI